MSWWLFQNVVITAALASGIVLVGRVSGARLGPVLFQLPPNFKKETASCFVEECPQPGKMH